VGCHLELFCRVKEVTRHQKPDVRCFPTWVPDTSSVLPTPLPTPFQPLPTRLCLPPPIPPAGWKAGLGLEATPVSN
jgi:hypothetical protein